MEPIKDEIKAGDVVALAGQPLGLRMTVGHVDEFQVAHCYWACGYTIKTEVLPVAVLAIAEPSDRDF